ncbi:MAG: hypothetical protein IJO45_05965 [Oscillospiraceae bacterium]|nr:hypothetical protein [Oscillospiraceae bacterium]
MKLRTSYFNRTVFKKNFLRFAPVWSLYTVFLLLIFSVLMDTEPARVGNDLADLMGAMAWLNLLYGGLCANVLFGDLFNPRMCNALHALPMRREDWFLTHIATGMLFSFVPNLLGTAVLFVMLDKYYYLALLWLAIMTLQYLFFFGIGTLSVMCGGSRLAMAAVYFIINFISLLVYVLADQFYEPLLYGIRIDSPAYEFFCPTLQAAQEYVNFYYDKILGGVFQGLYWDSWYYLFAIAALGVIALVGAVLLYRRRRLECAGDFLALRPLEPVFLIIFTLGVSVALYAFTQLFGLSGSYPFMVIGIVAGFFAGKMLLERTVKVFRLKTFIGFIIFTVVLIGSLVLTKLDPLGITWYVPETDEIEFMRFYRDNDNYIYNDPVDENRAVYQLESVQQIDRFRQIHSKLQADRDHTDGEICQVEVMYQLKNGSTVMRYYNADVHSAVFEDLQSYFSTPEYIFCTDDADTYIQSIRHIELDLSYNFYHLDNSGNIISLENPEDIQALMQAILKDCQAGIMAQDYTFHPNEDIHLWVFFDAAAPQKYGNIGIIETGRSYRDLTVFSGCENTLAFVESYLQSHGFVS